MINDSSFNTGREIKTSLEAEVVTLTESETLALFNVMTDGTSADITISDIINHPNIKEKDVVNIIFNMGMTVSFLLRASAVHSAEGTETKGWYGCFGQSTEDGAIYLWLALFGNVLHAETINARNYLVAPALFSNERQYSMPERVIYNSTQYVCSVSKSTLGSFVASEWIATTSLENTIDLTASFASLAAMLQIAPAYDATKTYSKGDLVTQRLALTNGIFTGVIYEAKQDIASPEPWTSGHWERKLLSDVLSSRFFAKQNTLYSGENIKTVNNLSLLGSGNIDAEDVIFIQQGGTTVATWENASNEFLPIDYIDAFTGITTLSALNDKFDLSLDENRHTSFILFAYVFTSEVQPYGTKGILYGLHCSINGLNVSISPVDSIYTFTPKSGKLYINNVDETDTKAIYFFAEESIYRSAPSKVPNRIIRFSYPLGETATSAFPGDRGKALENTTTTSFSPLNIGLETPVLTMSDVQSITTISQLSSTFGVTIPGWGRQDFLAYVYDGTTGYVGPTIYYNAPAVILSFGVSTSVTPPSSYPESHLDLNRIYVYDANYRLYWLTKPVHYSYGEMVTTTDVCPVSELSPTDYAPMIETTWAALKALRDAGNLIPGMQYRITDYVCTTEQEGSHSVGNKFDIIVTADSPTVLNERARAAHHAPDVYATTFSDGVTKSCYVRYAQRANWKLMYVVIDSTTLKCCGAYAEDLSFNGMNLTVSNHASTDLTVSKTEEYCDYFHYTNFAKWELKYSLDNDTDRFAWADAVNGKGVIYWMKDEFGNECPYDFKNIVFDRKACIVANMVTNTQYFKAYHRDLAADITVSDVPYYAYTNDENNTRTTIYFLSSGQLSVGSQAYDSDGNAISGVTLQYYLNLDCYNIFTFTDSLLNIESGTIWSSDASLNVSYSTDHWEISVNCYRNIVNFHTTAAGIKSLNKESLGFNIIQGEGNVLGVGCHRNMVLRSETVLGSLCYDNVLNAGNSSTGGILGRACYAIQSYGSNIFGASCDFIRLPSLARGNVFGASCSMIHLSSGSVENSMFGDNCGFITCDQIMLRCVFEGKCSNISILSRLYDCSFASQCQYLTVQASSGNSIYNVCVHKGVSGTSTQWKNLSLSTSETDETNVYTSNSSDVRV